MRHEDGVGRVARQLCADGQRLLRDEGDALAADEVRAGDAVQHRPRLILHRCPAVGLVAQLMHPAGWLTGRLRDVVEAGLLTAVSRISHRGKPDVPAREPDVPAREPDVPVRAPDVLACEPDVLVREPDVLVREPDVLVREPDVLAREPDVPAREPDVLAREPDVPEREPECPGA